MITPAIGLIVRAMRQRRAEPGRLTELRNRDADGSGGFRKKRGECEERSVAGAGNDSGDNHDAEHDEQHATNKTGVFAWKRAA